MNDAGYSEVNPGSDAATFFSDFLLTHFKRSYYCYAVTFNLNSFKFFLHEGGGELVEEVILSRIHKFFVLYNIDKCLFILQTTPKGKLHAHGVLSIKRVLRFRKLNPFYDMQIYLERTKVFPTKPNKSSYNAPKALKKSEGWVGYACRNIQSMWQYSKGDARRSVEL